MLRPIDLDPADGRISPADHATLASWFEMRGGTPPPRTILPTLGVFSSGIAAAFLYLDATGSGLAFLAWSATDPAARPLARARALLQCWDFLEQEARDLGCHTLLFSPQRAGLARHLSTRGYHRADEAVCHMFKPLA